MKTKEQLEQSISPFYDMLQGLVEEISKAIKARNTDKAVELSSHLVANIGALEMVKGLIEDRKLISE